MNVYELIEKINSSNLDMETKEIIKKNFTTDLTSIEKTMAHTQQQWGDQHHQNIFGVAENNPQMQQMWGRYKETPFSGYQSSREHFWNNHFFDIKEMTEGVNKYFIDLHRASCNKPQFGLKEETITRLDCYLGKHFTTFYPLILRELKEGTKSSLFTTLAIALQDYEYTFERHMSPRDSHWPSEAKIIYLGFTLIVLTIHNRERCVCPNTSFPTIRKFKNFIGNVENVIETMEEKRKLDENDAKNGIKHYTIENIIEKCSENLYFKSPVSGIRIKNKIISALKMKMGDDTVSLGRLANFDAVSLNNVDGIGLRTIDLLIRIQCNIKHNYL